MRASRTPESYIPPTGWSDHSRHDAASLALHCKTALKIDADRALLNRAKDTLAAWRKQRGPGGSPECFREWEKILTLPWRDIAAILISTTEEATRLRSSSPFVGILTEEERERILEAFRP